MQVFAQYVHTLCLDVAFVLLTMPPSVAFVVGPSHNFTSIVFNEYHRVHLKVRINLCCIQVCQIL